MAGRPREPIDLIKAKGKKHLTKAEYEQRKAEELEVPFHDVKPPKYLDTKQKREFREIAKMLLQLNVMTELDEDVLAQFLIAKSLYLEYNEQLNKILEKKNIVHKWGIIDRISENCEDAEEFKEMLEAILRRQRGDDATVLMNLQDKAHKQCLACAKELGLTITSRLKMVIPSPPDGDDDEL